MRKFRDKCERCFLIRKRKASCCQIVQNENENRDSTKRTRKLWSPHKVSCNPFTSSSDTDPVFIARTRDGRGNDFRNLFSYATGVQSIHDDDDLPATGVGIPFYSYTPTCHLNNCKRD